MADSLQDELRLSPEAFARGYWVGTSDEVAKRRLSVIDAGSDHVIFSLPRIAYDHVPIGRVSREIIPPFRSHLRAAGLVGGQ